VEIAIWQAIVLGIVEGVTEFLPISSTGHLTIVEKMMGLQIDDPGVTAYTAIIQMGAIAAVIIYFAKDIGRLIAAWFKGLVSKQARQEFDYRFAWYVILGSIPIGLVGYAARDVIKDQLRSLWVVAFALLLWSGVMAFADRAATHVKDEKALNLKDTLIIGFAQCLALIPGVSRSGATITVGLLRDYNRVTATRLSFFLGILALTAAGVYELPDAMHSKSVSGLTLVIGTAVSFVVAYASIAWLLRYVANHTLKLFIWYRVLLALAIIGFLVWGG
jgi:undecaprenyl-diphosphatase